MSTTLKEWLKHTIAELEEERDATPGAVNEDATNALAAMKIALGSLEAEPVCVIDQSNLDYLKSGSDADVWPASRTEMGDVLLYRSAQPAPVYDSLLSEILGIAKRAADEADECAYAEFSDDSMEHSAAIADWERRAAMLQGAEHVSNRDELPDGWVACSERMPDIGTEIFYFCQDDGLRDCGIVSSSNFSGKGDAQLYVYAEGYDLRFGVDITHLMPLPAAPQQRG